MGSDDVTWSYSFTAWKSGQPHSDPAKAEAKDCVKIDTTNLWGLVDCTKEKNFACQVAAEEVTTTTQHSDSGCHIYGGLPTYTWSHHSLGSLV